MNATDNGVMALLTVGHGALDRRGLIDLLGGANIDVLVDVRSYPGSRRNEDVKRDLMAQWVPQAGMEYRWEPRLGGRRHLTKDEDSRSPDQWWQMAAFRAYAAHTRTEEFGVALRDVLATAESARVAVMCSESVWWRCHRRLIADVVTLAFNLPVHHLMHDGSQRLHEPSEGARLADRGVVVWDGVDRS